MATTAMLAKLALRGKRVTLPAYSWLATAFGRHTQHTFRGTHSHTCGQGIDLAAPHAQAAGVAEQTSPWTTAGSDAMVAVGHVPAYFGEAAL